MYYLLKYVYVRDYTSRQDIDNYSTLYDHGAMPIMGSAEQVALV